MKLYMYPLSSNARRVRLVAHHLALPVEEVTVDLFKAEHKKPEYLALNPGGKVPTLVDGALTLTECYAIMVYLCEKSGRRELWPEDLAARADVNRWLFWGANEWSTFIRVLNFENMIKPLRGLGAADPVRVQDHENSLTPLAAQLDAHLATREFVTGSLSLADFALSASLTTMVPAKLPLTGYGNILKWFGRIQQLPAWSSTNP